MTTMSKMLIGSGGLAATIATLAIASPAAAQQPYPYNNNNGGVVGAIINSVTGGGYGQYPMGNYGYNQVNERSAVSMCAAAAEQRLNYRGQGNGYNNDYANGYGNNGYQQGYANGYGNNGYQQGYANGYNGQGARVLGITNVERRSYGSIKVSGVATTGRINGSYGNLGGYNNGYQGRGGYDARPTADLRFTCRVSSRGQVSDVSISRNQVAYRGY